MSQIINNKRVLLAIILLVALVALCAEAQRGYYGGGGRGYHGGGRGYYGGGRGGYGYGRGGYGGGYGRGGYGGGYGRGGGYGGRGYYRDHYDGYNSVYPSYSSMGGGGGYYDDGTDYSSYGIDVYASSSSNPTAGENSLTSESADGSSNRATIAGDRPLVRSPRPMDAGLDDGQQQPSSLQDLLNTPSGGDRWASASAGSDDAAWQLAGATNRGHLFDLVTSDDQSAQSGPNPTDRASERNVLAPAARTSGMGHLSTVSSGINNMPSVPTSTTTPAPEFIMINPTTNS